MSPRPDRSHPDNQPPEPDAVDRLLLAEVVALGDHSMIAVIDDQTGALVTHLAETGAEVRFWCDAITDERTVLAGLATNGAQAQSAASMAEAVTGASLVVYRLPKSLAALQQLATVVAERADPEVVLIGAARVKHMSRGMNDVLAKSFGEVSASLAQQKCRALIARQPVRSSGSAGGSSGGDPVPPRTGAIPELKLQVRAYGGVFAGTSLDLGTRLLIDALGETSGLDNVLRAVDLGSGSGLLTAWLARHLPDAEIHAIDESEDACRSTRATLAANGLADHVRVTRGDRLESLPDGSVDLIVCNPPFHRGTTKDSGPALAMIADAARALRPGGRVMVVYNAHLPYLPVLNSRIGSTAIAARSKTFLVTTSRRRVD